MGLLNESAQNIKPLNDARWVWVLSTRSALTHAFALPCFNYGPH